jgi:hypothetical protein
MRRSSARIGRALQPSGAPAGRRKGALLGGDAGATAAVSRHGLWTCLALLYGALIFALSATPGGRLGGLGLPSWLFNVAHVPLYGGLASLVVMAFTGSLSGLRRGLWPTLWTLGAVGTYALSDELHQRFVPDRTATLGDVGLDLLGAAFALGLMHAFARRRADRGASRPIS